MHTTRNLLTFVLVLFIAAGCGGPGKPQGRAVMRQAATAGIDPKLPAAERLNLLATRERELPANLNALETAATLPPPPGVENAALRRRDADDPMAFRSLEQVLGTYSQINTGDQLQFEGLAESADVDPDDRAAALKHYAKARTVALEGRMFQAIIELQKAHELDPQSSEILRELARCYSAMNSMPQAIDAYERLLRIERDNATALFALGLSLANRREFEQALPVLARLRSLGDLDELDAAALVLADFALATVLRERGFDRAFITVAREVVDFPDHLMTTEHGQRLASVYRQRGEMWRSIGDAHARLGEFEHALGAYAAAAKLPTADPAALPPRVIFANLNLHRTFQAQHELFEMIAAGAGPSRTISERDIRLCAYVRDHAGDIDVLAEAVGDVYRDAQDHSSIVRAAAALLPPDRARDLLREFVARRPRDLDGVSQLLAWAGSEPHGDPTHAADLAITLAAEHPDLADAYADRLVLALGQPSTALRSVRMLQPSAARAQMEAKLLWKAGALGEAWFALEESRQRWPGDRALALQQLQLAAALQESAIFERTYAQIQHQVELNDTASFIALSQAHRALGQMDEALALAQRAVEHDPEDLQAMIELSRAHLSRAASLADDAQTRMQAVAEVQAAVQLAERVLDMPRRDDEPLNSREQAFEVLALISMPGGVRADTESFRQLIQRIRSEHPDSPLLARLAAQDELTQRPPRYERALERLLAVYDNNPLDAATLSLAVSVWQQARRLDEAEQWLNTRLQQRPGDAALIEQWVRVLLMQNRNDEVIATLASAVDGSAPDTSNSTIRPDEFLARRLLETVYRASGDMEAAMALGERRLLARPQGVRREVELAALYAGAGHFDESTSRLEWIRDNADDATLDELAGALRAVARIEGDKPRRDELNLQLVHATIERYPDAPLQVYGSGLRAIARMSAPGALNEKFDELADRAVRHAKNASGAGAQSMNQWRELAQGLVDDGQPLAAAHAVRARLRAAAEGDDAALDDAAMTALTTIALVADAAADAVEPREENVQRSIALLKWLEEQDKTRLAVEDDAPPMFAYAVYRASILYTQVGSRAGADALLRETIRLLPDHAMALNNLGYALLEAGHDDEETIEFIERAHALMPNEHHILDTVGWLRYKQGRFDDEPRQGDLADIAPPQPGALAYIQRSMQNADFTMPEVIDHFGDVLWRLGRTQEATDAWRQAAAIIEDERFRAAVLQSLQVMQTSEWRLVVSDPRDMYDREFGSILKRTRDKIEAADANREPPIALTFEEAKNATR